MQARASPWPEAGELGICTYVGLMLACYASPDIDLHEHFKKMKVTGRSFGRKLSKGLGTALLQVSFL